MMDLSLQSHAVAAAPQWRAGAFYTSDTLSAAQLSRPVDYERGVGGDFCDVLPLADGRTAVIIGDASGHGASAAARAAAIERFVRILVSDGCSPAETMWRVNQELLSLPPSDSTATLFFGIVDANGASLDYASAGHEPPLLFRRRCSAAMPLMPTGPLIGGWPAIYKQARISLEFGDILALFTDGYTEGWQSSRRCLLGAHCFQAVLGRHLREDRPLSQRAWDIYADVCYLCGTERLRDDALLLLIEIIST